MDPIIPGELKQAFDSERARAQAEARQQRTQPPTAMRVMTVRMYGRLAELQDRVIADRQLDMACARGCAYCCHLRVEIRPHEAFVLAQHIQTHFDAATQARIRGRIDDNLAKITKLSAEQHIGAGIPCALLVEGACSVYAARPAACRKYHSVSVETCRNAYADTSAPLTGHIEDEQVRLAGNAVALGFAKGLEDAGLDTATYELHGAVKKALESGKPEKRYRDGKKPFV